jgi:hypothetical protein
MTELTTTNLETLAERVVKEFGNRVDRVPPEAMPRVAKDLLELDEVLKKRRRKPTTRKGGGQTSTEKE